MRYLIIKAQTPTLNDSFETKNSSIYESAKVNISNSINIYVLKVIPNQNRRFKMI